MNILKSYNKGYRFILVVIDVFSKYSFARQLKSKSEVHVDEALESIIKESGRCVRLKNLISLRARFRF